MVCRIICRMCSYGLSYSIYSFIQTQCIYNLLHRPGCITVNMRNRLRYLRKDHKMSQCSDTKIECYVQRWHILTGRR